MEGLLGDGHRNCLAADFKLGHYQNAPSYAPLGQLVYPPSQAVVCRLWKSADSCTENSESAVFFWERG